MRRGSKPEIVYDENRVVLGVNLSADFCAEHEWGIKDIRDAFGLSDETTVYGLKRRQITRVPKGFAWVGFPSKYFVSKFDVERGKAKKTGDVKLANEGFVYHDWYYEEPEKLVLNTELYGIGLRGAWSDDDFAAISSDPEDIKALKEIFNEFGKLNIAICFSAALPAFDNAGLVFAIADRLPQSVTEDWFQYDYNQHQLRLEVQLTGIEELLKNAGKGYYALSPRRRDDGSVWYWLNPYEQNKNNAGWFTLEDLKAWIADAGPIPMKVMKT